MPRLRKLYRSKEPLVLGVVSTALLLFAWEVFAREHWVDPAFSSQPTAIAQQFMNMYVRQRDIYFHLWISLEEAGLGFALALLVGVPTGMLLGRVRRVRYVAEPFIMAFYSTPTVALFPLLILWFGIGTMPKVLLIFLGGVFSILVNTQTGVENVDARLIETALAFRATEWQIFRKIMLPLAAPGLFTTAILAFIASWNEFLLAAQFSTTNPQPVTVAIAQFTGSQPHQEPYTAVMAAGTIVTVPLIIMVLFFQRAIVSGLTAGGVKG